MSKLNSILVMLSVVLIISVNAFASTPSCKCGPAYSELLSAYDHLEYVRRHIPILESRVQRAIEARDATATEWGERCEALECKIEQVVRDGDALLQNFLADPANASCMTSCPGYIRIQKSNQRKQRVAETNYQRCLKNKAKFVTCADKKIARMQASLVPYLDTLVVAEHDYEYAQCAYEGCMAGDPCYGYGCGYDICGGRGH